MIFFVPKRQQDAGVARATAGGFTLLEVLLAIFFFSVIITTIFGAYTGVLSKAAAVEDTLLLNEMAQVCLNRISLDLQSIYVAQPPIYKQPAFDSTPDPYRIVSEPSASGIEKGMSLRFTSRAHVALEPQARTGVAEIFYYIKAIDDDQFDLRRSDRLFFDEPFEPQAGDPVLCEHIKMLTFGFIDAEGKEHEEWNSESDDFDYATPRAIVVHLEIGTSVENLTFETRVNLPVFRDKVGTI